MKIEELKFKKSDLEKMPSDNDRILFFQSLNLLTEINILMKLSSHFVKMVDNPIIDKSIHSHQIFITLIKVGKLFEGWEMLRKNFLGSPLAKTLEKELGEKGRESLTYLKGFFGRNNHFADIRNTMAFHSDSDEIIKQYNDYDDEEPFAIYWSEYATNIFSTTYFSVLERLLKKIDPDNKKASSRLFDDITAATLHLREFIGSLVSYYVEKYLGETTEHEIPNEKNIPQHKIPYFADGSYFDE